MDAKLQELATMIGEGQQAIRKKMIWEIESNQTAIMNAMILAANGKKTDPERYVECKKILKENASIFSEFRGISQTMVVSKMLLATNPDVYIKGCLEVYKKLRAIHKLTASPFMVMAAMTIYENGGLEAADENIQKLETLYKALKKDHPWLITDEDRGYLAMLVVSGIDTAELSQNIEKHYQACKKISINKDGVNSLAQVLALSNKSVDACANEVNSLILALKEKGHPVSKSMGLGAMAALVLNDLSVEANATAVAEVSDALKAYKGFKWYNMGKRTRAIYASLIVFMANSESVANHIVGNISSTLTMVLVEQLIMAVILLCTTSASSAARSSSSSH